MSDSEKMTHDDELIAVWAGRLSPEELSRHVEYTLVLEELSPAVLRHLVKALNGAVINLLRDLDGTYCEECNLREQIAQRSMDS